MSVVTRGAKKVEPCAVVLQLTNSIIIRGKINLYQSGRFEGRMSDVFVLRKEPFVVVFDAWSQELPQKTFVVNKQQIVWISPDEEGAA